MLQVLECILLLGIYFFLFYQFGQLAERLFRVKADVLATFLIGFFFYFGVFQIVALPLIFLKKSLTMLTVSWIAVLVVALVGGFIWKRRLYRMHKGRKPEKKIKSPGVWEWLTIALVFTLVWYAAVKYTMGWDTAYYIGTVNTSLVTDTMYQYNGTTGQAEYAIPFRYAMSAFYMHTAVMCKIFHLPAMMVQQYVVGSLCIILYAMLLYKMGKLLFHNDETKCMMFIMLGILMNFFFQSDFTTSQFLLMRAYEAKAYCGNVVVMALFCVSLLLLKDSSEKMYWRILFLVAFASVPVSMSSILIAPVMVGVLTLADVILHRNFRSIYRGMICMLPNMVYLLVYYLSTAGILVIRV